MTLSSPTPADLISPDYRAEQERLHAQPQGYGGKGRKWADLVADQAEVFGASSILDYGAGQGSLCDALVRMSVPCRLAQYDPAVPEWSALPQPADLVVCTDVLEHVEPEKVDAVLDHLQALTAKALFVVISTVPTAKTLSDGRQAHISLHSRQWWASRMAQRFAQVRDWPIKPEKQWVALFQPRKD